MPENGLSPPLMPYGADQTIYLVVDSIGVNGAAHEIELERPDRETVLADLLAGKFSAPARVIAFNTLEHWSRDISRDVAEEIRTLCDIEGHPVPEDIIDFVEAHIGRAGQLIF